MRGEFMVLHEARAVLTEDREYLGGEEITVTVMPPGDYTVR